MSKAATPEDEEPEEADAENADMEGTEQEAESSVDSEESSQQGSDASLREKEIRDLKDRIPGKREEAMSIVSSLNEIASSVQREMATSGTSLITIVISGRHPENSGVFEIECPQISEEEKACAKFGMALTMSEYLGKVKSELSAKI